MSIETIYSPGARAFTPIDSVPPLKKAEGISSSDSFKKAGRSSNSLLFGSTVLLIGSVTSLLAVWGASRAPALRFAKGEWDKLPQKVKDLLSPHAVEEMLHQSRMSSEGIVTNHKNIGLRFFRDGFEEPLELSFAFGEKRVLLRKAGSRGEIRIPEYFEMVLPQPPSSPPQLKEIVLKEAGITWPEHLLRQSYLGENAIWLRQLETPIEAGGYLVSGPNQSRLVKITEGEAGLSFSPSGAIEAAFSSMPPTDMPGTGVLAFFHSHPNIFGPKSFEEASLLSPEDLTQYLIRLRSYDGLTKLLFSLERDIGCTSVLVMRPKPGQSIPYDLLLDMIESMKRMRSPEMYQEYNATVSKYFDRVLVDLLPQPGNTLTVQAAHQL